MDRVLDNGSTRTTPAYLTTVVLLPVTLVTGAVFARLLATHINHFGPTLFHDCAHQSVYTAVTHFIWFYY